MVKKFCYNCKEFSYSAAAEGEWICPICGADLTDLPVNKLDAENCNVNVEQRQQKVIDLAKVRKNLS